MPLKDSSAGKSNRFPLSGALQGFVIAAALLSHAWAGAADEELLLRKCTGCHTASRWQLSGHAWPGWWWVSSRMRWVNGAPLDWQEQFRVVGALAGRYPARGADALEEWLLALLAICAAPAALLLYGFRRRRRASTRARAQA